MSPTSTNEWRETDNLLGSGGFGNVRLFVNKVDGAYLVVKECKQKTMTERMKIRWQNECDIMLRLDCPYIVKSVPLPDELKGFNILSNPVLAMEYCNSGDLRKELNHPHNMFGLEEIQVKAIAHDISDAIKYLHNLRIYHRDLKPENIVLHKSPGRRIVYKIIDLGYAKEVSQDSICTSFVGTIQYLAPELLSNSKPEYTGSVDYWSLGTTIFECISGFRPFVHFSDMFVWLQVVRSKSDKDIYAYPNNINSAIYSDRLPKSTKISSTSQIYFEAWLRQMLMYDPKRRGGMNEKKNPACFELLDKLFQHKPLHVFDPLANESHFFDIIGNESLKSVGDLSLLFCRILNISPDDHFIFMTTTGLVAENDSCLTKYRISVDYNLDQELEEVDIDLILVHKVLEVSEKKKPRGMKLDQLMASRQNTYDSTEQLKLSKHLAHYCWTLYRSYQHLLKSNEGIKLCLLRERTQFKELVETHKKVAMMLQSRIELFSESLAVDLEEAKNCSFNEGLLERWLSQNEKIIHWEDLIERGQPFVDKHNAIECKIHECLKRLYPECEGQVKIKPHFQTAKDIVEYCRNSTARQADKLMEITNCLQAAEKDFEQFSKESRSLIRTIMDLYRELLSLKTPIEKIIPELESATHEITATQASRQRDIWRLIENKKPQSIASSPTDISVDLSTQQLCLKSMDLVKRAQVLLSEKAPLFL